MALVGETAAPYPGSIFSQMCVIHYPNGSLCSGVILNKNKILTAAHCSQNANKAQVQCGSEKAQVVGRPEIHPLYTFKELSKDRDKPLYDMAILETNKSFPSSRHIKLLVDEHLGLKLIAQKKCEIFGAGLDGKNHSGRMKSVKAPKEIYLYSPEYKLLALRGKSAVRRGDSGGVLLCRYKKDWVITAVTTFHGKNPRISGFTYLPYSENFAWLSAALTESVDSKN